MKNRKFQEVYCFTYKKIDIYVKIDYYNNKISLMQPECAAMNFAKKQWVFADRGVEFMNGWLEILEAMKEAIKDAKSKYEKELAVTSAFDVKNVFSLLNGYGSIKGIL